MADDPSLFEYLLRLGDSPLSSRSGWASGSAMGRRSRRTSRSTNVGLDLLGQARLWLSYAGEVEARFAGTGRSEDELAFLRDGGGLPQPAAGRAAERQLSPTPRRASSCSTPGICSLLRALTQSQDARIAEIAAKAAKEAAYHVERSGDWVIRLGDGTDESHARMQAAIDDLWMYTGEMFAPDGVELALVERRDRRRRARA